MLFQEQNWQEGLKQVRKAIDELRDKKIRRKGGDSGEWEIIG
jgi:hypothetical protein